MKAIPIRQPQFTAPQPVLAIAAYAAIYLLWGASFFAIREVVIVVPPLFAAGIRYLSAGLVLLLVCFVRGEALPTRRQLRNTVSTGAVMFTLMNGTIFWAETRIASWVASLMFATIPLWTYLAEWRVFRVVRLTTLTLLTAALGLLGAVALFPPTAASFHAAALAPAAALLTAALGWTVGSLALQRMDIPPSPLLSTGLQLASSGATLLCISLTLGEWHKLAAMPHGIGRTPLIAMAYLVFGSSLIGTTAYRWLLTREPAFRVATVSYVNPIVAMLLGILVLHESWTPLQLAGAGAVLSSTVLIFANRSAAIPPVITPGEANQFPDAN